MRAPGPFYQPLDTAAMPRFTGIATFMRLPYLEDPGATDIALVGVPFDGGTTNRAGARHGPREVRNQSSLIRRIHHVHGFCPFDLCRVADTGDVSINPTDPLESLRRIEAHIRRVAAAGATPLSVGGDHMITLPILRGLVAGGPPLGLVHFDAHSDTTDSYFGGTKFTHGTPFRRAIEEGLLDPARIIQVGIRGSLYDRGDLDFARAAGIRIVFIEEVFERGRAAMIDLIRQVVGDQPCYLSFDIDSLDPVYAPGTGTPEIGGLSTFDAQVMLRGLRGLNYRGADLVEVAPPLDPTGNTALVGANLLFEILCLVAETVGARTYGTAPA